jgi:hypothetical protein
MAAGRKTGGGSRAGSPNKATAKREAEIAASGLTPLDYMLKVLRNPKKPHVERMKAAVAAAPYVHPRLASTQASLSGALTLEQLILASYEPRQGES